MRFLGGGVYEIARYDLKTLKCLNTPANTVNSGTQTAFYPYYPKYGKFVSLQQTCADGVLCFAASYEGNAFGSITLQAPPEGKAKVQTGEEARVALRRRARIKPAKKLWQDAQNRRFTAFVVAKDMLIATGHTQAQPDAPFLVAIRIKDGMDLWQQELPADAVKGGIAVDDADRIFVSLENGQLLCFVPAKAPKRQASKDKPAPPTETKIEFIGQTSMKLYDKGAKFSKLPQQQTDDALGPFEGKGVYFKQRNGLDTSVSYKISSAKPVREIHFKGAATDRMTMEILDLEGKIVFASSGPFRRGNVYSEHKVKVPAKAGQRFILRFRNHTSTWFYIEKLTLK